jgi:tetratricopeptide (TPR) repeat protein
VAEVERAQRKPTESLQAYDLTLRASADPWARSRDSLDEAIGLLQRAVAIDPRYAMAQARLAWYRYVRVAQYWKAPDKAELEEMVLLARKAVELDGDDPEVLALSACVIGTPGRDLKTAVALVERALALNPNCILALNAIGYLQAELGNGDAALEYVERAGRLNPLEGSALRNNLLSYAHRVAGRYEEACVYAERALQDNPNFVAPLQRLAACLALLGRIEEARAAAQRLLAIAPETTIARVRAYFEAEQAERSVLGGKLSPSFWKVFGAPECLNDHRSTPRSNLGCRHGGLLAANGCRRGRHACAVAGATQ